MIAFPVTCHRSPVTLFRLFVSRVAAAAAAELPELQALRRRLLVLRRHVVAALALGALQHNVVAWHKSPSKISTVSSQLSTRPSPSLRPETGERLTTRLFRRLYRRPQFFRPHG